MDEIFSRNELFWGESSQKLLSQKHVAVFGLGGVGGYCAEMLARAGVGELTVVDFDVVSKSNINRQILALHSTLNQSKAELTQNRLLDINPKLKLNVVDQFYQDDFSFKDIDYVADAIDTMRSKVNLLQHCVNENIPVVSSFGAGNRMDPTKLYVCDISEIKDKKSPFISNLLYQLSKKRVNCGIKVVASSEKPKSLEKIITEEHISLDNGEQLNFKKVVPASTPFVASTCGIIMAYCVINDFLCYN